MKTTKKKIVPQIICKKRKSGYYNVIRSDDDGETWRDVTEYLAETTFEDLIKPPKTIFRTLVTSDNEYMVGSFGIEHLIRILEPDCKIKIVDKV